MVKILMKREDVRTAMPDNMNQTPQLLVLSDGHGVVRIPRERGNANCAAADCGGLTSLLPATVPRDGVW